MIKKALLVGCINLVAGMGMSFGFQSFFPFLAREYQNPALFRPWSDPLMMIFLVYPFISGFVFAYLWNLVEKNLIGDPVKKAFHFAQLYFVIATIPGMFITYTTFQVSLLIVLSWALIGFFEAYIAGLVFTKIK